MVKAGKVKKQEIALKAGKVKKQGIALKDGKVKKQGITIKRKVVQDAISILKKLNEKYAEGQSKKPLFEDSEESPIFLQVTLKKLPPKSSLDRFYKIQLPHSLVTSTIEVCLITGDLDKQDTKAEIEPTLQHYKELLNKHGVERINEVVSLRQLRTEYKTYESKRQLSAAYDVFLCDKKIAGTLPKTLGKAFYDHRKFPIQVNLSSSNLKEQIERQLSTTVFPFRHLGGTSTSEVARLSMEDNEILENILACVKELQGVVAGRWLNILGLYLKTPKSEAIPIYMSFDSANELKIKVPRKKEKCKAEELSTFQNAEVKVFKDGRITVKGLPPSDDENSADEAEDQASTEDGESNDEDNKENGEEIQQNKENGPKLTKKPWGVRDTKKNSDKFRANKAKSGILPNKKSKKRRRKSAKKAMAASEAKNEEVTIKPEVDVKSPDQKDSKKRKSIGQSIKSESAADLNVSKQRKSQSNMEKEIEKKSESAVDLNVSKKRKSQSNMEKEIEKKSESAVDLNVSKKRKSQSNMEKENETNDVKEETKSPVKRRRQKRKSIERSIKIESAADLNVSKKRKSQSNMEKEIETNDVKEETKSPVKRRRQKRKSIGQSIKIESAAD